jgi:hypothetical protein
VPYFLKKLKDTPGRRQQPARELAVDLRIADGQLERAQPQALPAVLRRVHAGGALKGNLHIKAADGTPMANAMLGALRGVGLELDTFGDSSAVMDLNKAPSRR